MPLLLTMPKWEIFSDVSGQELPVTEPGEGGGAKSCWWRVAEETSQAHAFNRKKQLCQIARASPSSSQMQMAAELHANAGGAADFLLFALKTHAQSKTDLSIT